MPAQRQRKTYSQKNPQAPARGARRTGAAICQQDSKHRAFGVNRSARKPVSHPARQTSTCMSCVHRQIERIEPLQADRLGVP